MKKTIVALAVLGSFAGVAAAQSSVTLFGIADVAFRHGMSSGKTLDSIETGGLSTSRFGVRGQEDLGGGMKASFWLESAVDVDSGGAGSPFWARRSTLSLSGSFGEVRLGRFKSSERLLFEAFDPSSTTGIGSTAALINRLGATATTGAPAGTSIAVDLSRFNNLVTYILPGNLGGFYGSVDQALDEKVDGAKMSSVSIGFKASGFDISSGMSTTNAKGLKFKMATTAGSYNFGVAKAVLMYTTNSFGAPAQKQVTGAVIVPLGAHKFYATYTKSTANAAARLIAGVGDATHMALSYQHSLSKRTALYTTYAKITNTGLGKFAVGGSPAVTAGQSSSAYDVGVRHSF
jgi:predicted porin